MKDKEYLGDSVYVSFEGYGFTLTTENGKPDDPSNTIYLEPPPSCKLVEKFVTIPAQPERIEKQLVMECAPCAAINQPALGVA